MADNLLGAKEVVPGNKHFIAPKSLWVFVCLFVLSFGTKAVFASDTDIDIASLGLANDGFVYSGNPMQLGIQMVGSVATVAFVLICMGIVFKLIDVTIGLRVSREEELRGLDIGEHGMEAYGGFQIFSTS